MTLKTEIMASFYQDSVVLMRIAVQIRKKPGVREVALFMGTPANHALLDQIGLATEEGRNATPNDLIITVDAAGDEEAATAIASVKEMLIECRKSREASSDFRPRTLDSALRTMPDANLVSISIPGPYVKYEAMAALHRNLHCFIFSDNVPIEDEIALKKEAMNENDSAWGRTKERHTSAGSVSGSRMSFPKGEDRLCGRIGNGTAGSRFPSGVDRGGDLPCHRRRRTGPLRDGRRYDDLFRPGCPRRRFGDRSDHPDLQTAPSFGPGKVK